MNRWIFIALLVFTVHTAQAVVKGEEVEYKAGDTVLKGYLAYDDALKSKRPGVIVVHEWWGHNEYARNRARMLAERGYTALALDMYGEGHQAHHPDEAGKLSGEVRKNPTLAKQRFDAALRVLKKHPSVNGRKIAAIGYCSGGSTVLEMARAGTNLKGVVSFHGNLTTERPASVGKVKTRMLVLTGADDPFVPAAQVEAFKKEMDTAKANYRVVAYPGARHSFTNPDADRYGKKFDIPLAYNAEADQKSWAEMQAFFKEIFAKQ